MAGYTPLFSTLTTGTLCGKWPDIGLWPIILSMADKNGHVDCTCAYIAGVTGLAIEDVTACMRRFCEPDPGSRSDEYDGARLVLLDDHRDWGWRIVNHGIYREKARLAAKNSEAVSSGREAERKRHNRQEVKGECPPVSAGARLTPPLSDPSDADADADADKEKNQEGASRSVRGNGSEPELPLHGSLPRNCWDQWLAYRRERRLPLSHRALALHLKRLSPYDTETQQEMLETAIQAGWSGVFPPKGGQARRIPAKGPATTLEGIRWE